MWCDFRDIWEFIEFLREWNDEILIIGGVGRFDVLICEVVIVFIALVLFWW